MKLSLQCGLLVALAAALVYTFHKLPDEPLDRNLGNWQASEPSPITLRTCAKDVIVRAVINDGLSLPNAAALCGEIYRRLPDPPGLGFTLDYIPNPTDRKPETDEELLCRRVIDWVTCQGQFGAVGASLEAEFRAWRNEGTGRLPDPAGLKPSPAELLEQARAEWQIQCRGERFRKSAAGDSRRSG